MTAPRAAFDGRRAVAPQRGVPLVAVDANALDRTGSPRDALVDAFRAEVAAGRVRLFVPSGVLAEMRDPGAPAAVRDAALDLPPPPRAAPLTARQHIDRIRVRAIMRGDGRPGKHDADAAHLSEAAEAGCDAFLTRDGKILRKRDVLLQALPSGPRIATLDDFLSGLAPDRAGPR
ncbi:hypothetical protein D3273_18895 [Lichenibacterium minor]|uniref:PIN domain-containing protein n=1 Tax=Lichenibacterium minor TaxID=2316528 RepID=A0A4Q2U6I3_9HYPH|nr:type II toxin-antitoxin system VapC family toxin [Lichenibacterium minor]RYC30465.1 hypothetical protein D3273_18895 [Lichenibacterium minor]